LFDFYGGFGLVWLYSPSWADMEGVMIILLQTSGVLLGMLDLFFSPEILQKMFWTDNYREVLFKVRELKDLPERTIVLSSNVFHPSKDYPEDGLMTGAMMASAVKDLDPEAWFFIFSLMFNPSEGTPQIDGLIPKDGPAHFKQFLNFDFSKISSLEELFVQFPWARPSWNR